MFSPMKGAVRGKQYDNTPHIMNDIHAWFNSKEAFELLPTRWNKCIHANLVDNDE